VARGGEAEIEVKGSRFRGACRPARTVSEAMAALDEIRREERRATHVCWALRAPEAEGSAEVARMHDAGEPTGTAGRPILQAIDECAASSVMVAVARVFGGVKLGAGGLRRAYHRVALDALRASVLAEPEPPRSALRLRMTYGRLDAVRRAVARLGGSVAAPECASDVALDVRIPVAREAELRDELASLGVTLEGA
jgi:putative IMPACT (imprinted ancient) family translation regulator